MYVVFSMLDGTSAGVKEVGVFGTARHSKEQNNKKDEISIRQISKFVEVGQCDPFGVSYHTCTYAICTGTSFITTYISGYYCCT